VPRVNPKILIWARETAGLSLEDAARQLSIKDTQTTSGVNRLQQHEETGEISRPLLVRMSKQYRRPLLTFYLTTPPIKGNRGKDFRTLPKNYSVSENNLLDALLRNVMARQSIIRSVLEDDEDVKQLSFVGTLSISDGVGSALNYIKQKLQISQDDFYSQSSPDAAFSILREAVESEGVFVILVGDLGNYRSKIEPEIFRGFALADSVAPFIVINDRDSHSAWSFTLIHEYIHIWLGQTGVSNAFAKGAVEQFCNDVAGEFLLSSDQLGLLDVNDNTIFNEAIEKITEFATDRNLSSSMVTYKLFRSGAIQEHTWAHLNSTFRDLWQQNRIKKRNASGVDSRADYYRVKKHRIGKALIQFVDQMMLEGSLSTYRAGMVLGIKAKNVQNLIDVTRST
jgi:Zn-dependent peptidase ImmA (M78 family)